ncbi:hypothetical protein [Maritimibacter sp. DP1N21-5]|uniref:hypothetical protein n=1 Tax=Maritimibacter sp. DP1N21-5 TaxID=2836867 RepID=UPI001C4778BA|nr:hypothetical protein [Maritimibacter sp. DP1N21-5]MBV7407626.1 hypothetical protein [Maritimibacter sp. DP1N21-5]
MSDIDDTDLAFSGQPQPRTIWVFELKVPTDELPMWEADGADEGWPLPRVLGVESLDPAHVEVFPDNRIAEYGLARYLADANGMDESEVAPDAAKLESVSQLVVLVHAKAVTEPGRFSPQPPARFVGKYAAKGHLTASVPPMSRSAEGVVAGGGPTTVTPTSFPWRVIALSSLLVAILALLIWWVA